VPICCCAVGPGGPFPLSAAFESSGAGVHMADFDATNAAEDAGDQDFESGDAGDDYAAPGSYAEVQDGGDAFLGLADQEVDFEDESSAYFATHLQGATPSTEPTAAPLGYSSNTAFNNTQNSDLGQELRSNIRPDNQHRWQQKTADTLANAKALTRAAMKRMNDNESVGHGSARKQTNTTATVHNVIKKKISATEDLVKALEDRIESLEDSIRQVGECLFSLQRAHRSKWAPLNVAERRLEMRGSRPLQELIRDHCQEALEHERSTLIEARQELADQIESVKEMLLSLDSTKSACLEDLQQKRQSLRVDRQCLGSAKNKAIGSQDRVILPHLHEVSNYGAPPSPKHAGKDTGPQIETSRQVDARQLITSAVKLEEEAMRFCNSADAAMIHTKRECGRACAGSANSLARRYDETDDLKRRLEAQVAETDDTINMTKLSRDKLKKKLDAHDVPLRTLDKQFAMRQKRTPREGIRDHVHEELEAHLETVKKNVSALANKWQTTNDVLNQLQSTRTQLHEDYRCKAAALKIEDACMKVTPRKAMELDRMDPRGGRCLRPSSNQSKTRSNFNMSAGGRSDGFGASAGFAEGSLAIYA